MEICLYGLFEYPTSKATPLRLLSEARSLAKKGHKVTVFAKSSLDDSGLKFIEVDDSGGANPLQVAKSTYKTLPRLRNYLDKNSPDILHAHQINMSIIPAIITSIKKTKFVYEPHTIRSEEIRYSHSNYLKQKVSSLYVRKLENMVLRSADGIVALTNTQLDNLKSRSKIENTCLVPGGCPPEFLGDDCYEVFGDYPVVSYAGSLHKWNGIDRYLEIVKRVKEKYPDFSANIITYQDKSEIEDILLNSGVRSEVNIVDNIDSEKLPQYLNGTDILICPTPDIRMNLLRYPSKLSFYLASTAAVVASRIPSHESVVRHKTNGLLYTSINQAADQIVSLISNSTCRKKIAKSGRRYVEENLTWEKLTERIEALYRRVSRT